jgi:cation diffusion facilitator family transporter
LARTAHTSSKTVIYAALAGNLLVALTKTAAAFWTGSASMASEAVHSLVDTGNELLLLYGVHRAGRRPDAEHPLGYGRELYFWSFVVALVVFALGAGVSLYQGVVHILHPGIIRSPIVNYVVLALAFLFEGASWLVSLRQFRSTKGSLGFYEAIRRSKDPPSFIVLLEDSAALLGILVAAAGIFLSVALEQPLFDGAASIVVGLILGMTAIVLARESKSLLIGEQAPPSLQRDILAMARREPSIDQANGLITVQLAPDQVVAMLSLKFAADASASQIEEQVVALERKVQAAYPSIVALFVKPQAEARYQELSRLRFGKALPLDR